MVGHYLYLGHSSGSSSRLYFTIQYNKIHNRYINKNKWLNLLVTLVKEQNNYYIYFLHLRVFITLIIPLLNMYTSLVLYQGMVVISVGSSYVTRLSSH